MKILITGGLGRAARGGIVQSLEEDFELRLSHYREPEKKCRYEFVKADLRKYEDVRRAVKGVDAIVHLGAKSNPNEDPLLIYSVNVMGTANLLEAALAEGIKEFIYGSSLHIYGIPFHPDYLPLDEKHPVRPYIPYGFSKLLSETLGEGYTRRGMTFTSLRIGRVCLGLPGDVFSLFKREDIACYARTLWSHIDARDLGQLIKLCLRSDTNGFEVFNAVADDHIFPEVHSSELIKKFLPDVKKIRDSDGFLARGDGSFVSVEKAKRMLGYKPEYNFRDYLRWMEDGNREEDYYEKSDIWQR